MRISYANVVATLALVLAVGGTAFAASSPKSSSPATLKLCAAKKNGDLRLLSGSGGACRSSERAVSVDREGTAGPAGANGPVGATGATGERGAIGEHGAQGERGPAGPGTVLASPDGRFTVSTTNAGIVLAGPKGSVAFDGLELIADRSLAITVPINLTVTAGAALDITNGATGSWTTGASFAQNVGGAFSQSIASKYDQTIGAAATQNILNGFSQTIGGAYDQTIGADATQTIEDGLRQDVGGTFDQTAGGAISQRATTTFTAVSPGKAKLTGSSVDITGNSTPTSCVTALGYSHKLDVC